MSRNRRRIERSYRAPRQYVRGDRGDGTTSAVRYNAPDGALTNPLFWVGSDGRHTDWSAYGGPKWPYPRGAAAGGVVPAEVYSSEGILPAVTRATNLIVGPVVRTTWRFFRGPNQEASDIRMGAEELPRPLWITDPQLTGRLPGGEVGRPVLPHPRRLGAHDFYRTLLTHALWWGHAAMLYVEDVYGVPLAGSLRVVSPARWAWTEDGRYVLGVDTDTDPIESDESGYFQVGPLRWRMVSLHGFAPQDGTVAEGVLARSGLLLDTGQKMNSYLNSILSSGVPSGVLRVSVPNYPEAAAQALRKQWMDAHGGEKKSVAVLSAGIDFSPLQLSVVDSDVVRAKGTLLVDIAHAFGLSAALLDAATGTGSNLTYANLGDRRRDHLDHTLAELGRSVEDFVTALLPWGQAMSIDWTGYLATDPTQMIPYVSAGIKDGWLTIAEARDILRLSPVGMEEGV